MSVVLPDDAAVGSVRLRSADVPRSAAFYRDVAGLEELGDGVLGWGGRPLVELSSEGVDGGRAPRAATGLFHTAIRFAARPELGRALERVVRAGVLTGASDHGVSEALYLDDPDGNGVELYWDRPRALWPPPAPGERIAMFTAPLDLEDLLAAGAQDVGAGGAEVDVGHVHLKVSDVARAVEFWSGVLGFELMTGWHDAAFLAAGGYHHHVGMNSWQSRGAAPGPRERPGLDEVRLVVPGDGALAAVRERLEAAGAEVADAGDGALGTRDPDGIRVVLAAA